ncbi:hypothetical protein N7455_011103 [Penicillium solitum]|uniref:uncharacterized protein n=1 Tax=Penicillium solitum TaxID=60172 RepID=UPI0032C43D4E|nr:hypothetical protein N7455_011103 [Penicillium solitum]
MSTLNKPAEPPMIPEIISWRLLVSQRYGLTSKASRLSEMSVGSTTSDILDVKLAAMESEL